MQAHILSVALISFALASPGSAVVVKSAKPASSTQAPADDPGWSHVGVARGLTAIYLGDGWILSAAHVGSYDVSILDVVYPAVIGSRVVLLNSDGTAADLELFRIDPYPEALPSLTVSRSAPVTGTPVVMIGNGFNRGDPLSFFEPAHIDDGFTWMGKRSGIGWGTNEVSEVGLDVVIGNKITRAFRTNFNRHSPETEAQAAEGDSGGAVFVKRMGNWELAGVMFGTGGFPDQPGRTAIYGNVTYCANLAYYRAQIVEVLTPQCGNGHPTLGEECDRGGRKYLSSCCSPTCEFEPRGASCDDGDPCTEGDLCDSKGFYLAGESNACEETESTSQDGP